MKIRVLAFASAAEALGGPSAEVEVPDGSRVADLRSRLESEHPALAPLWERLAVAVDGEIAGADAPLRAGSEVALLPPVSGGVASVLVDGPLDVEAVRREVSAPQRGAVLVFVGTVRDSHAGRPVTGLTYEAYRPMAEAALARIMVELEAASSGLRLRIVHRLGEVGPGEASVVIAAASPHREAAYRASREALERLKREVPIWKRELYADGAARWREEEPLAVARPSAAQITNPQKRPK